jgi:hypothetical protein
MSKNPASERPRTMTAAQEEQCVEMLRGGVCGDRILRELQAERAAHDATEQTLGLQLEAISELNKLRLDDSLELIQQVEVAVAALNEIACYVPGTPQSFEKSLETVTDIADKAHVEITAAMDAFNNKPSLAERAARTVCT